ncbi:carnitine/acyl carnitine carrier [Crucibulum laeve]|uniref:Carnitine/acyl carnitine carrier n=1 Tax=Crucibulum laeve TaxID=68775 RepID=A0A5C3LV50_9AGAR|nr:carnitine/acyl carnitine carrier [Crucibulum laeve]
MRLRALPLALLSLILPAVSADQANWSSHSPLHGPEPAPAPQSTTLVDALSADPDYTSLLHLLQRARLIPTLNKLNGSTFFAPTNDAIDRRSAKDSLWHSLLHDDSFVLTDNINEQLRQQLFYHLLNYSVPNVPTEPADPQVHKTLHFPRTPVEPPSKEPPPSPPWMPIPGGTLGGDPQRLRVGARSQGVWVGVDAFGEGGSEIVKGKEDAGNGVLLGIADVLDPPPSLSKIVSREASVSYFHKILTPTIRKLLNETPELTLFLPVDEAWKALDPYERLYLESEYASDDLVRILDMHAVVEKRVRYAESFQPALNLTTLDGTRLEIVVTPEETKVADAKLIKPDIYASNGVLHLVDSLLVPPGALQLTPEKYLLALNCTQFVSLLHSVNLKSLINNTETKYTILAPRDDVLSVFGDGEIPEKGSPELKKLLQYHFIPGKWSPSKLDDGLLLETSLEENGLDGDKQVLAVEVGATDKKSGEKSIRFGGAGVIGDPVEANNMLIYFVSRPLIPPSDSLQTALPFLDLSIFLAAVFSTSQAETLRTTPRTSLLMPQNLAFKRLGMLVSAHLLSASSKQDLENVILHHTLDTVEYAHSLQNGSQHTFATLEGSDIKVERTKNGTGYISSSGGWAGMKAELYPKDLLTQTGVIHELSDVLIPRSVQLSIGKLVKAAKGSTMATLVNKAGFDWILNGTAPPEDSEWADAKLGSAGWTLLCPPDDAFKDYNLTQLYADDVGLKVIVTQHLIPSPPRDADLDAETNALNNNQPLALDDSVTYSTLRSSSSAYGDIVFQQRTEDMQYVVGIKGARGTNGQADWARVLSWGRSTTGGGTGGVIQIDRLLVPYQPPWWIEYGAPSTVGAIGVAPTVEETRGSAAESVKAFIAGGFGGVAAVLVGHPFDLTKTRLQTASPGTYTGAVDVVKKTLARDGVSGLYRGMVPPLLGVTPIFAISFWAYDTSKQIIFALTPNRTTTSLSVGELATAGFMSAVPTTLVTAPVERAKVLLQVQGQGGSEHKYKGVADVLKHLYKEGGMRSIFRGTGATLARDGPGSAAYFAAYEVTKRALTPAGASPADLNLGAVILAGGTAGVAMWALAIPPDVLKSRIQSAPTGTYSGLLDCARKTIAQDGVRALWKGFAPAMARAFPANAATFLGVEASRKVMDGFF